MMSVLKKKKFYEFQGNIPNNRNRTVILVIFQKVQLFEKHLPHFWSNKDFIIVEIIIHRYKLIQVYF